MASEDPTLRLLATGTALAGAAVLMTRPAPSWEGVLVGISCAAGWAALTVAARATGRPPPRRRPPIAARQVQVMPAVPAPLDPVAGPEIRSHRQRMVERHQRLGGRRSLRSG
ncbi:energy transducer TonB [Methylobacterium sp. NEAU 140]|uniref:energy transducer TonB n=1 Tax=Methylobacterium sp. NEAU 140 TaxID=3064945 RepID=UPI002733B7BE|nr:energy transducer TonB [Methylobacterium sp. NEAU 140]MDP4025801.1 energy transducer TonB [Methylobacterium sp. NEAU 140]